MDKLKEMTQELALKTVKFVAELERSMIADIMAKQLLRAGTSVGANYRAAIQSKSPADFIAKMGIVEEEADECMYWMDLLGKAGIVSPTQTREIKNIADQIVAMTVASIKTARSRHS